MLILVGFDRTWSLQTIGGALIRGGALNWQIMVSLYRKFTHLFHHRDWEAQDCLDPPVSVIILTLVVLN